MRRATLAIVFLAGAMFKAMDINLFTIQIRAYGLFRDPFLLAVSALGTLAVETALGMALLIGFRLRGLTHAAVSALLLVFSALILYGWIYHDLADCGCFGPIELSPQRSLAKNALFFILVILAYWGRPREAATATPWTGTRLQYMVCLIPVVGLVAYAVADLDRVVPAGEEDRPFAQFVFEADGAAYDLGVGEHLVALYNATCEDCMASVNALNALAMEPEFPPIVALCWEPVPDSLEEFRLITEPYFPIYSLGDRSNTFFSLVGDHPPRFHYVRDGKTVKYWDDNVPQAGLIRLARTAAHTALPPLTQ